MVSGRDFPILFPTPDEVDGTTPVLIIFRALPVPASELSSFLMRGLLPVARFSTVRIDLRSCPLSLIITIQLISYNGCKFRKKIAINIGE